MTDRGGMKVIGGSTISEVIDISPWGSPHGLYLKLAGEIPPAEETEAMARGNDLEHVVAMMFGANHPEFSVEKHGVVEHPEYPFLIASPDRVLIDAEGELVAGLEIKTADINTINRWGLEEETDDVPDHYAAQCLWYSGMLGVPVWHIAVGFVKSGSRKVSHYREYIIETNPDIFNSLVEKAIRFWTEHVEKRVPPPITQADNTTVQYLRRRYPSHDTGIWIEPTVELNNLASDLIDAQDRLKQAEKQFELYKAQMMAALGTAEGIVTPLGRITYKASKSTLKTDWKAVADELDAPVGIVQRHTKDVPGSRRFLISKVKGIE